MCTFYSKEMEKNFTSENRTKTVFKDLLGNLAIRFSIIMKREKRRERKKILF